MTSEAFQKDSQKIFGYAYTDEKVKRLRDFFFNARTLYAYWLNGGGKKASNSYAKFDGEVIYDSNRTLKS